MRYLDFSDLAARQKVEEQGELVRFDLLENEGVILEGLVAVRVRQGSVSIFGYHLTTASSWTIVLAPRWAAALPLTSSSIERSVVECRSLTSAFGRHPVAASILPAPSGRVLTMTQDWAGILDRSAELCNAGDFPRIVVRGPKSAGKSFLCTYLINSLLNSHSGVFVLDVDLGQPLISPPGMVSLTHVTTPLLSTVAHGNTAQFRNRVVAVFCGGVTVGGDPGLYVRAAAYCLKLFRRFSSFPLVINTHGWIEGLGAQVTETVGALAWGNILVDIAAPAEIPQSVPVENFDVFADIVEQNQGFVGGTWSKDYPNLSRFLLTSWKGSNADFNDKCNIRDPPPKVLRWMRFASHLDSGFAWATQVPSITLEGFFGGIHSGKEVRFPSLRAFPVRIRMSGSKVQIGALNSRAWCNDWRQATFALTGSLVALCRDSTFTVHKPEQRPEDRVVSKIEPWPCEGLGLVHSYDSQTDEFVMYVSQDLVNSNIFPYLNTILLGVNYQFIPPDPFNFAQDLTHNASAGCRAAGRLKVSLP